MMFFCNILLCILHMVLRVSSVLTEISAGLDVANKGLDVANKGIDTIKKADAFIWDRINENHDQVAKAPDDLISSASLEAAIKNMAETKLKEISFQPLPGFSGMNSFEPAGWTLRTSEAGAKGYSSQPEASSATAPVSFPHGPGFALLNGCWGSNYQKGDPCFASKHFTTICLNQIDAANFIGVGFDGRGFYSPESRKMSIIQRDCAGKATFDDKQIPDNMNIFGIYDYKVETNTYESIDQYMSTISEKSATSSSTSMFSEERQKYEKATSGSVGIIGGMKFGHGHGESSVSKESESEGSLDTKQKTKTESNSNENYIAILSAELTMFEITLDSVSPDDIALHFFQDFLSLPTSYYTIGADAHYQSFVLRYGTHFIRSGIFGGQLKIIKTSTSSTGMTAEQFATTAESEFKAMTSTLKSSYKQTSGSIGLFGMGGKHTSKSQESNMNGNSNESKNYTSNEKAEQEISSSEFMKTELEVTGGNPEIALAIMDFYKPGFRSDFQEWLKSVPEHPKPFSFTMHKNSKLFDINIESMFKEGEEVQHGCNKDALGIENGKRYYISKQTDENNVTISKKVYCKYGIDKQKFMDDFKERQLSLERAENIYMAEGPFSTTSFNVKAGNPGCESNLMEYMNGSEELKRVHPSWDVMKSREFKVLFELPVDLPFLTANTEVIVKLVDSMWFYKNQGGRYYMASSCPTTIGYDEKHLFCVAGLQFAYDHKQGYFKLSKEHNEESQSVVDLLGTTLFMGRVLYDVEAVSNQHVEGELDSVPCNVKWSNAHRIATTKETPTACIHFSAASAGNIYMVFSEIPRSHSTWFYIRLSMNQVQFYQGMRLKKDAQKLGYGTLGDKSLYENFFVCITQGNGEDVKIDYGKAPVNKEIGQILSSYRFPKTKERRISFYSFASGEDDIEIDDLRIHGYVSQIECTEEGMEEIDNTCRPICHDECLSGCYGPKDNRQCEACKNVKHDLNGNQFECLEVCPIGKYSNSAGNCVPCRKGTFKETEDNEECTKCSKGTYLNKEGSTKKCLLCPTGSFADREGSEECTKCKENTFSNKEGSTECEACPSSEKSPEGAANCDVNCLAGTYQDENKNCVKAAKGHCVESAGATQQTKCKSGTYQDQEGQPSCKACPPGTSGSQEGADFCHSCIRNGVMQCGFSSDVEKEISEHEEGTLISMHDVRSGKGFKGKTMDDYINGFTDTESEYWVGLHYLNILTTQRGNYGITVIIYYDNVWQSSDSTVHSELRGSIGIGKWDTFKVGAAPGYRLEVSGNEEFKDLGEGITEFWGKTNDKEFKVSTDYCRGGWWLYDCNVDMENCFNCGGEHTRYQFKRHQSGNSHNERPRLILMYATEQ